MGKGMAEFIEKEVLTVADYDLYCHYVAGLVGIGLSQVSALSHSGSPSHADGMSHMGLSVVT
jgi:farnesyl-diphosphate farnesyltransferase